MSNREVMASLFKRLINRNDAVRVIGHAALACYLLAVAQALVSFVFFGLQAVGPAILYTILGIWLQWRHSRSAAVTLLMLAVANAYGAVTGYVDSRMTLRIGGWVASQFLISVIFVGYRSWQATYRLASATRNEGA